MKKTHVTRSPAETQGLAQTFVQKLDGGEVIGLKGDLGTGKTTFVKGLAKALNIDDPVRSPSYTILNIYETTFPSIEHLVHVDLYRLENGADLRGLELDHWLQDDAAVVVIEWPERASVETDYAVTLRYGDTKEERTVIITG